MLNWVFHGQMVCHYFMLTLKLRVKPVMAMLDVFGMPDHYTVDHTDSTGTWIKCWYNMESVK